MELGLAAGGAEEAIAEQAAPVAMDMAAFDGGLQHDYIGA